MRLTSYLTALPRITLVALYNAQSRIAQLVEHLILSQGVVGSNPTAAAKCRR